MVLIGEEDLGSHILDLSAHYRAILPPKKLFELHASRAISIGMAIK